MVKKALYHHRPIFRFHNFLGLYWILGAFGQLSNLLLKSEVVDTKSEENSSKFGEPSLKRPLEGFYVEHPTVKESFVDNSVKVSLRQCPETSKNLLYMETDLPGDVVVHWGVCRDEGKNWEVPAEPHPDETITFKNKALRTLLQVHQSSMILILYFCIAFSLSVCSQLHNVHSFIAIFLCFVIGCSGKRVGLAIVIYLLWMKDL